MKNKIFLAGALVAVSSCGDIGSVEGKYSDLKTSVGVGYPELALELGRVDKDCVLDASQWEPVFIKNNITTGRRVTNALQGMQDNHQIMYFQDKRVIAVVADFCQK